MSRLSPARPEGFDPLLPLSEQAFFWVVHLETGTCTDADHAAFDSWLEADPRNGPAYREAAQLWHALAQVGTAPARALAPGPARVSARRRLSRRVSAGLAGLALLAASVGMGFLIVPQLSRDVGEPGHTEFAALAYETSIGETRRLVLADGTQMMLGGDTAVEVRFGQSRRQAVLVRGQVFLDVTHDPARPLDITAGAARVRVLGTSLDIRLGPAGSTVSLIEGRVSVGSEGRTGQTLAAGQQILVSKTGALDDIRSFDPKQILGWQENRFYFENASLEDLVADLNRYSDKPIEFEGDALKSLNITTSFSLDQSQDVLASLAGAASMELVEETDRLVLRYDQ
ncbi:MAG: FecR family protein [Hyphomonas sp.]